MPLLKAYLCSFSGLILFIIDRCFRFLLRAIRSTLLLFGFIIGIRDGVCLDFIHLLFCLISILISMLIIDLSLGLI